MTPHKYQNLSAHTVRRMLAGQATAMVRECGLTPGTAYDERADRFSKVLPDGTLDEFAHPCPYLIGPPYVIREPLLLHRDHGCPDPLAKQIVIGGKVVRYRYAADLTASECRERTTTTWTHGHFVPKEAERFFLRFQTVEVCALLDLSAGQILDTGFDSRHGDVIDAPDRDHGIKWRFLGDWDFVVRNRIGARAKQNPLVWFCTFDWDIVRTTNWTG